MRNVGTFTRSTNTIWSITPGVPGTGLTEADSLLAMRASSFVVSWSNCLHSAGTLSAYRPPRDRPSPNLPVLDAHHPMRPNAADVLTPTILSVTD